MTKQAVFELSNNDPEHYGELSARIDIPWNCRRVKYWVDSVNTFSEMLVTEKTDYVDIHWDKEHVGWKSSVGVSGSAYASMLILTGSNVDWTIIKSATSYDFNNTTISLWKHLWTEDNLLFYTYDADWGSKTVMAPIVTDSGKGIVGTVSMSLSKDSTVRYITAVCEELNLQFTWERTDLAKFVPRANALLKLEEVKTYVDHRFMFPDLSDWKVKSIKTQLNKILRGTKDLMVEDANGDEALTATDIFLTAQASPSGTGLTFSLRIGNDKASPTAFGFADMSHRASLVTGYYNYDFDANWDNELELAQTSPCAPLAHFGNLLYLVSNNGNVIHSSNCQNPSVIYRIQQAFIPNAPILQKPLKSEREEIIADGSALRELKITLTDRWLNPVKIKTPLVVTIKMQPVREDIPTYG